MTTKLSGNLAAARLAGGFGFTEGPIWRNGVVEFTDVADNAILSWSPDRGAEVVVDNSHAAIGLTVDHVGRRLACEHTTRCVSRTLAADGPSTEVVARSYEGRVLNSTNDVVVRSDGQVMFTDPPFGVRTLDGELHGYQQAVELDVCGVYAVTDDPDAPHLLTGAIHRPNGLVFDRREERLFVSDSSDRYRMIVSMSVDGDTLGPPEEFAVIPAGVPDGMAVDVEDRLFVAGLDGVYVYDTHAPIGGRLLGRISCPEMVTNCCFGGDDLTTLFLTATTSLYSVRLDTPGIPVPQEAT